MDVYKNDGTFTDVLASLSAIDQLRDTYDLPSSQMFCFATQSSENKTFDEWHVVGQAKIFGISIFRLQTGVWPKI